MVVTEPTVKGILSCGHLAPEGGVVAYGDECIDCALERLRMLERIVEGQSEELQRLRKNQEELRSLRYLLKLVAFSALLRKAFEKALELGSDPRDLRALDRACGASHLLAEELALKQLPLPCEKRPELLRLLSKLPDFLQKKVRGLLI